MRSLILPRAALRTARLMPVYRSARLFSVKAEAASASKLSGIDPKKLSITKTTSPKPLSKPEDLVFGKEFTGARDPSSLYRETVL